MLKLASLFVTFAEAERPVVNAEAQAFWSGRGRDLAFRFQGRGRGRGRGRGSCKAKHVT